MRALMAMAASVILLAGGGGGGGESEASAPREALRPPRRLFHEAAVHQRARHRPGDGRLPPHHQPRLLRIGANTGTVARVQGTVSKGPASLSVGTFLELLATGPGQLIGSGHPDKSGAPPLFLGLKASDDGGKSWTSVSRL